MATAFMATAQAVDVDRRSSQLLPGRCFLAVASWPLLLAPNATRQPWGINSAGRARVESGLAREDLFARLMTSVNLSACWIGRSPGFPPLRIACHSSVLAVRPPLDSAIHVLRCNLLGRTAELAWWRAFARTESSMTCAKLHDQAGPACLM